MGSRLPSPSELLDDASYNENLNKSMISSSSSMKGHDQKIVQIEFGDLHEANNDRREERQQAKSKVVDIEHQFVKPVLKISLLMPKFNTSNMHEVDGTIIDREPILIAITLSKLGHERYYVAQPIMNVTMMVTLSPKRSS